MRFVALVLTVMLACASAHADERGEARYRRRVGLGLAISGILIGASAVSLAALPFGEVSAAPGAVGLLFTGFGVPLIAMGSADEDGPPSVATLRRRKAAGGALIGVGVAMQLVAILVPPFFTPRVFEYSTPPPHQAEAYASSISIG